MALLHMAVHMEEHAVFCGHIDVSTTKNFVVGFNLSASELLDYDLTLDPSFLDLFQHQQYSTFVYARCTAI